MTGRISFTSTPAMTDESAEFDSAACVTFRPLRAGADGATAWRLLTLTRDVRENVRGVTRVSACNYNTWAWQYEVYYMQSSASHPRTPASMHGSMFHGAPRLPANDRSTPYASDISSYFIRDTLRGNEFDL